MVAQVPSATGDRPPLENRRIADRLEETARLLEQREENPFRVRAYRQAAETVRALGRPAHEIVRDEGESALQRLPGIGPRMAHAIRELALTAHLPLLEELRGAEHPEKLLATVGGIGPELAARIHKELGVRTLEELEVAAHDGRLAGLPGVGPKRLRGIREALAGRLGRRRPERATERPPAPPVEELLEVDRVYRERAGEGQLRMIAPKRFNPTGEAWLPILRLRKGNRYYRALYSNTAQAHKLGKTRDWVVIYYRIAGKGSGQCTVVTAGSGPLRGKRVVRGREEECARYYARRGGE
ncbi:MAG TPA: helix-hairpin-helix domain-containing protein [Gemmataceae bacterium]